MNSNVFCVILIILLQADVIRTGPSEKRLLSYLFDKSRWDAHDPLERPSENESDPVPVWLKVTLNQIMDMDEKGQTLTTIIWLDMHWPDYHFAWKPSEFNNISEVIVSHEKVWKPDLLLYNSAREKFDQIFPTRIIANHNGDMKWVPPGRFHSTCDVKIEWFPFDSQRCRLKIGSWSHPGNLVDLKLQCEQDDPNVDQPCNNIGVIDLATYMAHSEWALESGTVRRDIRNYSDGRQYVDVWISVELQRKALYYMFNIIVPCMIMSVLALMVFTLPPEANEKIVLGVTTLLSLTMLLQLVADKLPQTSQGTPVLVRYFTCTIILCSLSLICAIFMLSCHHHDGGAARVPWFISTFVNQWLAILLFIDVVNPTNQVSSSRLDLDYNLDANKGGAGQPESLSDVVNKPSNNWSNVIDIDAEFRPKPVVVEHQEVVQDNPVRNRRLPNGDLTNHINGRDDSVSGDNQNTPHSRLHNTNQARHPISNVQDIPTVDHHWTLTRLSKLNSELRSITGQLRRKELLVERSSDWRLAARVLDRLCLVIFLALSLFTTVGLITSAPTIIKAFTDHKDIATVSNITLVQ